MEEAIIVLLLKPNKNPQNMNTYRPNSMINADIKLLDRMLVSRLVNIITTIVHKDQTGFIPNKSTKQNIRNLYSSYILGI